MKNLQIAQILENIADILELQGVEFKPRAYRQAARTIASLSEDIEEIYKRGELEDIPGVGKSIGEKIEEIIKRGKLKYYEDLKKKIKIDIGELGQIPGLGPKRIKLLYQKLKIKNLRELEQALKQNKLRKLGGFGEETEKNLLRGIEFVKTKPKRFLYAHVQPLVEEIKEKFSRLDFVKKIEIAGSFRRGKETVGDLDFLVVSDQPEKVIALFVSLPDVKEVLAKGPTRSSVRLNNGIQMDLRVVKEKEWGSALLYFIGNKEHNIEIRKIALKKGYTLSEYGLFKLKGKQWVAGRTEEEIYRKLGLKYIPPELRENQGELTASAANKLPLLITQGEVKGIFHNHTEWSDGADTLLEMAKKAEEMKFKFLSFNDHYGYIGIAHPLNEKRLEQYLKEIEKVRKRVGTRVFSGVEIDILKDGTLPLSSKKLKELEVVIGAVHLATKMSEAEMTKRVCKALDNYPINILTHPTGRMLNTREPYAINLEKVFEVAKQRNVFMEITSSPERMDLSGENVKAAIEKGCKLSIGTDAHEVSRLGDYQFGVMMARKGWATSKDILNCWELPKIEKALRK